VREPRNWSASDNKQNVDNDFDFDLYNGRVPASQEAQGVRGEPVYVQGAGFDPSTKTGRFQLAPDSPGVGAGQPIPNFSDGCTGKAPDMGAHQRGAPPVQYGVSADDAAPYPRSPSITGLKWADSVFKLKTKAGDNWPITWAEDDLPITAWGDGPGFDEQPSRLSLGFAHVWGNPPDLRAEDFPSSADTLEGGGSKAIKASGLWACSMLPSPGAPGPRSSTTHTGRAPTELTTTSSPPNR
jgi:hypothetical protein